MDDHPPKVPNGLGSAYDLGRVDPEVRLATTDLELTDGNRTVRLAPARLLIQSRPSLRLRFEGSVVNPGLDVMGGPLGTWEPDTLIVPELGLRGPVPIGADWSGTFGAGERQLEVAGNVDVLATATESELHEVQFLVPNFPAFVGEAIRYGATRSRNRLNLGAAGWEVTLDGRRDVRELSRELGDGSYGLTHVGRLTRADESSFPSEGATTVLEGLHWFLSFVRGTWVGPLIADGYGEDGEVCWRWWSLGRIDRWHGAFSWCDQLDFAPAQEVFRGYMDHWSEPFTNSVMRIAIGMYITANNPNPVETAIVTAQSGLELLGWLRFVESGNVSASEWRNKRASEKIHDLLVSASIDPTIPAETTALSGLLADWTTGPQVVAGVRNRLVHPRRGEGSATWPGEVLADTWLLSSRYLELCLLHLLGARSPIRNRLDRSTSTGAVAPPPWM
jgi:hypothetical protein